MHAATAPLLRHLDPELRRQIASRAELMLRHLRYLSDRNDSALTELRRLGWTDERLSVVFDFNAFYQLVLGPLSASARVGRVQLGNATPIRYGESLVFDQTRGARIRSAERAFLNLLDRAKLPSSVLTAPHTDDLIEALRSFAAME